MLLSGPGAPHLASDVDPLSTAVLPVLPIAVVRYVLGTLSDVDADPLATVTRYVLAPALVFHSLTTTDLGGGAIADIVARDDLSRPENLSTAMLTTTMASVPTLTVLLVLLEAGLVGRSPGR